MASFSIWHWLFVLLVAVTMFRSQRTAPVRWLPLVECGAGLLIAWLLLAMLRGL